MAKEEAWLTLLSCLDLAWKPKGLKVGEVDALWGRTSSRLEAQRLLDCERRGALGRQRPLPQLPSSPFASREPKKAAALPPHPRTSPSQEGCAGLACHPPRLRPVPPGL